MELTKALPRAVDEIMSATRSLWDFLYHAGQGQLRGERIVVARSAIDRWNDGGVQFDEQHPFYAALTGRSWLVIGDDEVSFDPRLFRPFVAVPVLVGAFGGSLVPDLRRNPELDYWIWRSIRAAHRCGQSLDTLRKLRVISEVIRATAERDRIISDFGGGGFALRTRLSQALEHEPTSEAASFIKLSIEIFLAVGDAETQSRTPVLTIAPECTDLSVVVSRLFGVPTRIPGFDDLFGGGGINLAERMEGEPDGELRPPNQVAKGRVILLRGRFGTGKSSLGLTLAAEVARKGGLAWVTLFEQSTEECLMFLESMALLPESGVTVLPIDPGGPRDAETFEQALARAPDNGILLLHQGARKPIQEVFEKIEATSQKTTSFPLRLLVFDPMNGLFQSRGAQAEAKIRDTVMKHIERAKATSANIVLVAEDDAYTRTPLSFLANLADTVIELSEQRQHGYTQRYVEVLKSRFQAERRGQHAMAIRSNQGLSIAPSTSATSRKLRNRAWNPSVTPTRFGWRELDEKMGAEAILKGDIIVIRGPQGTFKTQMALRFLLGSDPSDQRDGGAGLESLFVPLREQLAGPAMTSARERIAATEAIPNKDVHVVEDLPGGYVQPGRLIQILEEEFAAARARGKQFDRVVIANVERWELNCPFVRDDPMFPDVLVDLLRKNGATALIVGGEERASGNYSLQRSLVGDANVVIETRRAEFRGTQRIMLRITRTRGMTHPAEWFDVTFLNQRLYLDLSLERVDARDNVDAVKPKLLLHSDNPVQQAYNETVIASGLRATLATNVEVHDANRTTLYEPIQLGPFSSVWELQVVQLDEFQLPVLQGEGSDRAALHRFPAAMLKEWLAEDIDPRLRKQVQRGDYVTAVPYYRNVGVLTVRRSAAHVPVELRGRSDRDLLHLGWAQLAEMADAWPENDLFFDYQKGTGEDLNVLFLEIALEQQARAGGPGRLPDGKAETFQQWLDQRPVRTAFRIVRSLCHAASQRPADPEKRCNPAAAVVTRQWFTNLLWSVDAKPEDHEPFKDIEILPLPAQVGVSGDWYLAVPDHSAVPLVGLAIIKELTDRKAEIDRARRGLGLPTRSDFYRADLRITPQPGAFKHVPFLGILENAARRSTIANYARLAPELTLCLQEIVALPKSREGEIDAAVERLKAGIAVVLDEAAV